MCGPKSVNQPAKLKKDTDTPVVDGSVIVLPLRAKVKSAESQARITLRVVEKEEKAEEKEKPKKKEKEEKKEPVKKKAEKEKEKAAKEEKPKEKAKAEKAEKVEKEKPKEKEKDTKEKKEEKSKEDSESEEPAVQRPAPQPMAVEPETPMPPARRSERANELLVAQKQDSEDFASLFYVLSHDEPEEDKEEPEEKVSDKEDEKEDDKASDKASDKEDEDEEMPEKQEPAKEPLGRDEWGASERPEKSDSESEKEKGPGDFLRLVPGLEIHSAWFGHPDDEKRRQEVSEQLRGKEWVHASVQTFGDPAVGSRKKLWAQCSYRWLEEEEELIFTQLAEKAARYLDARDAEDLQKLWAALPDLTPSDPSASVWEQQMEILAQHLSSPLAVQGLLYLSECRRRVFVSAACSLARGFPFAFCAARAAQSLARALRAAEFSAPDGLTDAMASREEVRHYLKRCRQGSHVFERLFGDFFHHVHAEWQKAAAGAQPDYLQQLIQAAHEAVLEVLSLPEEEVRQEEELRMEALLAAEDLAFCTLCLRPLQQFPDEVGALVDSKGRRLEGTLQLGGVGSAPTFGPGPEGPAFGPPPGREAAEVPVPVKLAQVLQDLEPELGTPEAPTEGSRNHRLGTCRPCAFFHTKGCASGTSCEFCHLCDAGEKKRRARQRAMLRKGAEEQKSPLAVGLVQFQGYGPQYVLPGMWG
ncbi:unnamed protein product [Effrenium voratum]|nr:unnamed protein product [Effrenium voratum]